MHLRKPEFTTRSGVGMTPLIDMAFQLIAFFMFVLNFSNDVADERVRLPKADQAIPVEEATERPLFLNVDRQGRLLAIGNQWDLEKDHPAIRSYLEREAAVVKGDMTYEAMGNDAVAGDLKANRLWTTVVIRADFATPCQSIRGLIEACQQVGFYKFALRALPQEEL